MDVFEAIERRFSCRSYKDTPIERQKLERLLDAARLAPSAKNFQDWRFVVVTEPALKAELAAAANDQKFVKNCGAVIVACSVSDYVMSCGQGIAPIDVSIALEHIALEAVELGLGTCWIGAFVPSQVKRILGIPAVAQIIDLMTVGYPADRQPGRTKRQPIEQIASFERWDF